MSGRYDGRKVLVVGAARSGIAAAQFLLSRGARVTLTDAKTEVALAAQLRSLRDAPGAAANLTLELGDNRAGAFAECDLVVTSPGVPLTLPVFDESRKRGIPVIAEVELASRHLRGTILAVTGSNGKTTVATLLDEMMRSAGFRSRTAG